MDDDKPRADKLPGNHGQFGNDNATEEYEPLQPGVPAAPDETHSDGRG